MQKSPSLAEPSRLSAGSGRWEQAGLPSRQRLAISPRAGKSRVRLRGLSYPPRSLRSERDSECLKTFGRKPTCTSERSEIFNTIVSTCPRTKRYPLILSRSTLGWQCRAFHFPIPTSSSRESLENGPKAWVTIAQASERSYTTKIPGLV